MGDIIRIQNKRFLLDIDGIEVAWFMGSEKEDAIDTFLAACVTQSGTLTLKDLDQDLVLAKFSHVERAVE